jgi:hypothetical protein
MKRICLLLLPAIVALSASGCYYDKESDLYDTGLCDTSAVKFSTTIQPILNTHCAYVGCHTGSAYTGGGIDLSTYAGVKKKISDNALLGAIQHDAGYEPMPKNSGKLPECQISLIRTWAIAGAPNN